ncbi:hypothetical protein BDV96DRAFT_602404 [Lophiotrema nucula]|uniref:Uncharacterized protein n=1 Tax=Lophiotrema nucula TaxID=690887 RepID=A0A6A5YXQ8_9PLEO|nr:hypothetical protein BDV96DRAFT_602404 [Lophiotrema nucula]
MATKHEYARSTGVDGFTPLAAPQSHYDSIYASSSQDDPPFYTEEADNIQHRIQQLLEDCQRDGQGIPISEYPDPGTDMYQVRNPDDTTRSRQDIVRTFFDAIKTKKDEVVAALIESGLVTTETTNEDGRTPLLAAIEAGNIRTVQQLMDFDADINAYGITSGMPPAKYSWQREKQQKIYRTPLQVAAQTGNLTIVKLLMETYGADDSLVAPDGELALRLAASNGHREVVKYLPSRRGGGFRRWKTKHHKAMRRVKRAVAKIVWFFKIALYEVPKFFVWYIPKHLVVKPLIRGAKWLRKNYRNVPGLIVDALKWTWNKLKKIPKGVWEFLKGIPKFTKELAETIWTTIKRLPRATKIALLWIWNGLKNAGNAVLNVLSRFISFLHTALIAIANLFRGITLKDVWDGFVTFLRALIIDGPRKVWQWLCKFEDVMEKVFKALWGCTGQILWWLIRGIIEVFIYVPKKILVVLVAIGSSLAKGFEEVLIWFNPKRQ